MSKAARRSKAVRKRVRPAPQKKTVPVARPRTGEETAHGLDAGFPDRRPLRPIGPQALKNLREAIRRGNYPPEDAVRSGMERLLRRGE